MYNMNQIKYVGAPGWRLNNAEAETKKNVIVDQLLTQNFPKTALISFIVAESIKMSKRDKKCFKTRWVLLLQQWKENPKIWFFDQIFSHRKIVQDGCLFMEVYVQTTWTSTLGYRWTNGRRWSLIKPLIIITTVIIWYILICDTRPPVLLNI